MMISLLGGVTSIANMIFAPVMANVIETSGTVTAVLGLGIVLTVVTIIGNFMVCNLPSVYGAEMVDITKEKKSKSAKDDSQAAETQEKPYDIQMPASKLLRHPATIIALLIPFLGIVGTLLYMNYHVYVYESMGLDYTTAALFVSIASGATIIFSPLFGIACDKLGIKAGIIIFSGTVGITRILSPILGGYAGAIIFALFNGMSSYAFYVGGIVFPELFGQKNNATLNGWFGALSGLSSIVAAPLAVQLIAAANQSYDLVIYVSGALFLLSIVGIIYLMSDSTKKSLIKMDQKYLQKINNQ